MYCILTTWNYATFFCCIYVLHYYVEMCHGLSHFTLALSINALITVNIVHLGLQRGGPLLHQDRAWGPHQPGQDLSYSSCHGPHRFVPPTFPPQGAGQRHIY